tara:strand:- start:1184 stop:1390 length:207 start_codon:yes stop_codon:yes gene_type:complete
MELFVFPAVMSLFVEPLRFRSQRGSIMTRFFAAMTLLFIGMGLAACNTVEGAGRDIHNTGDAIEDAAN